MTVAVNVTGAPSCDGSGDDDTSVLVAALVTACWYEPLEREN
ncbi:hypothetical protein [Streptomyces sp. WMMB 322]|nr:hypothetical protein [Streptomyces sp. WMMB 322]